MMAHRFIDVAAQLAARGRYTAATRLLEQCDPEELGFPVADLRARIAAQRGDFAGAIAAWEQVLAGDPNNEAAKRGVARAGRLAGGRGASFRLRANLFVALIGLGVLMAGLVGAAARGRGVADDASRNQDVARSTLNAAPEPGPQPPNDAAAPETGLDPNDFRTPGVSVQSDGGALTLTFDEGMFRSGGTRITEGARGILADLGRRLRALSDPVAITVIGASDDVPLRSGTPWTDNAALSLARASTVSDHLRTNAGMPASRFSVQGLGVEGSPFSNATAAGRARNRTVVLRIHSMTNGS